MAKKMLIDATHAEETRVVVADGNKVEEFDFESLNKRQLAGNIYLAKVTRVEPSLQAAFVDYGGNRHGFLAFSEIHPDYYQIPKADREALLAEERELAAEAEADEEEKSAPKRRRSRRRKSSDTRAEAAAGDAIATGEVSTPSGMDVIDLDADAETESEMEVDEALDAALTDTAAPESDADPEVEADIEDGASEEDATAPAEAETIADDDDHEDIRPVRKPRARKYKIQEVIKVRQIILVQVVKEERGNKGAALTTYLSLAGRYCVLMPNTARGGGISRKITNISDRKKLKEIAQSMEVPQGAGLIIRTAGSQRTKAEIKRDYEYLQRQWEQVRELTLRSIAPAPIYEEGNLIHRSIRDLYNRDIDEVLVEGEAGYRQAKDFMKMIMPSHAKNVKHYADSLPLFARYQVEGYLADMFNPVVQLKSGGYIVIGITEALVAVDVNSGRATKEGSIEETALKTNLEAAEEVARQVRLRDLAGLIVIDFIDMDDRRNNLAVEKRLKDRLKTDRARIQVGRISGFGLLEMSRQRLRPGMLEATTQPCHHCHGTGLVRSDDSQGLSILRQLEEESTRRRSRELLLTAPVGIVNFIMNQKREYLADLEARYGVSIRVEADPAMITPDYRIEKFKTATRRIAPASPVVSMDAGLMEEIEAAEADAADEIDITEAPEADRPEAQGEEGEGKKRRRRRRGGRGRRRNRGEGDEARTTEAGPEAPEVAEQSAGASEADASPAVEAEATPEVEEKPKRRRSRKSTKSDASAETVAASEPSDPATEAPAEATVEAAVEEAPKPKRRGRKTKAEKAAEEAAAATVSVAEAEQAPEPAEEAPKPKRATRSRKTPAKKAEPVAEVPSAPDATVEAVSAPQAAEPAPEGPKKRGWWSRG
ncbi:Rne/Rng family ribonuclease [Rhodobacterales bacterium HKCCA1288]|jgi:ribonuclease E|uniref:Rne/Rng family ribonuclease n=1 Tax=Roseovarius sp. 10 TaxID=3080563 RepID=UPI001938D191|nr:ribonuclease E/G [Roseovarius sp. 10]MDV7200423.1 Rne/Rng family ribonuclease [Roseovarius sp. 10]QPI85635.1 Rne/Rng family ribonuclease [Rhodobacterales bacterium HKCCA1288]